MSTKGCVHTWWTTLYLSAKLRVASWDFNCVFTFHAVPDFWRLWPVRPARRFPVSPPWWSDPTRSAFLPLPPIWRPGKKEIFEKVHKCINLWILNYFSGSTRSLHNLREWSAQTAGLHAGQPLWLEHPRVRAGGKVNPYFISHKWFHQNILCERVKWYSKFITNRYVHSGISAQSWCFVKHFWFVPPAVGLKLQLLCSPIGNQNSQKKNKTKHHAP